ncbi:sodium-dependent bicarbonate transport family permease [Pseudoxanthomonas mexicana]|jgi:hypothetical protein|uniref:sodium-dependent bicarbonate transport family permease n=1 Tax=Pseudoxanthomonas mexicana TaxID=128785 RepID=UPI0020A0B4EC|nr:sodium-dependent bicarbonate transport family permease [Pseudoxanthomonas mexicana]MCP1582928.1 hypothetical protein [Pseudoxanthomonas mexicana]
MTLFIDNALSPLVLAFVLGFGCQLAGGQLRLADAARDSIAVFLLLAIGLKGGEALSQAPLRDLSVPLAATVVAGLATCLSAFAIASGLMKTPRADAAALAAHYGSASAVTFIAASQFVADRGDPADGWLSAALAVLEMPAILLAVLLAKGRLRGHVRTTLGEVLLSKASVLLLGGLAIGWISGSTRIEPVMPLFKGLFHGVLLLYLLDLGATAAQGIAPVRRSLGRLLPFALAVPLLHGMMGVSFGHALDFSQANAAVFGTLVASASYIAAPAAVRTSIPEANLPTCVTAALGITFPFNLILGIPLFYWTAGALAG